MNSIDLESERGESQQAASESQQDTRSEKPHRSSRLPRIVWGFALAATVGTIAAFFSRHSWIADALAHFAIQFAALLLVGAIVSACRRQWKSVIVFACCLGINLWWLAPYLLPLQAGSATSVVDSTTYRLLSFNVLRTNEDVDATLDRIIAEGADFVYLMEVHSQWKQPLENLQSIYPFQKIVSKESYVGVAFLSKLPWSEIEVYNMGLIANPTIDVQFELAGSTKTVRIIGTHPVPPFGAELTDARDTQLTELAESFSESQASLLIGDFNLSPWSARFSSVLTAGNLKDASVGYSISPTLSPLPTFLGGLKVDHVLRSENVDTIDFRLKSNAGSDHQMLVYDFQVKQLEE